MERCTLVFGSLTMVFLGVGLYTHLFLERRALEVVSFIIVLWCCLFFDFILYYRVCVHRKTIVLALRMSIIAGIFGASAIFLSRFANVREIEIALWVVMAMAYLVARVAVLTEAK